MVSRAVQFRFTIVLTPWCTGWLHQMGLIVVTVKLFLLVLQQPILIGWD